MRIKLTRNDLAHLSAGRVLTFGEVEVELSDRVTGRCLVRFSYSRLIQLEWTADKREECLATIRWYLDSGAGFVDNLTKALLENPDEIVNKETLCNCNWLTTAPENMDKPSPGKPWR